MGKKGGIEGAEGLAKMNASLGKGVETERESQCSMIKGQDYQLRLWEGLQKDCTLVKLQLLLCMSQRGGLRNLSMLLNSSFQQLQIKVGTEVPYF